MKKLRSDFLLNRSRFFRMIFKKYYLGFYYKLFFYFPILCIFAWYSRSTASKFSTEILKKGKIFLDRDTSKSRIFVCCHIKNYPLSRNLRMFLQWITLICTLKFAIRKFIQGCIKILNSYLSYKSRNNWWIVTIF